jgi:3-oxoacyl-[acyl-carrier-protein] synthase II
MIVITGIGTVSPLGTGRAALEAAVLAGPRPPSEGTRDAEERCVLRAAGFDPRAFVPANTLRRLDRGSALALAAARLAVADAGLEVARAPERVAVVAGTGGAGIESTALLFRGMVEQGAAAASAMLFPNTVPNAPAGQVAIALGASGPSATFAARGAGAEDAIAFAADLLALGRADAALAGGVDEVSPALAHGYRRLGALSWAGAGRPFDRARDGVLLAEGACWLVLETEEAAARRGARPLGRLLGGAAATVPLPPAGLPEGEEVVAALARHLAAAIAAAGLRPEALAHVSAAASGTRRLDRLEAAALGAALGGALACVPVSSVKGAAGDSMAGGALRAAIAVVAASRGLVPATAGLRDPDPRVLEAAAAAARAAGAPLEGGAPAGVDLVSEGGTRAGRAGPVLVSSFADGGGLRSLVYGPV